MGFFDSFKNKKEASAPSGNPTPESGMPMPPLPSHPVKNVPTTTPPQSTTSPTPAPIQKPGQQTIPQTQELQPPFQKKDDHSLFQSSPVAGMPQPTTKEEPTKPQTQLPQTQPPLHRPGQPQKPTIPDVLPTMPELYSQTVQPQYEENIPFFAEAKVEPTHDDFTFDDLPVADIEPDEELFKGFKTKKPKQPLYIRTDFYSQILTNLDTIKTHIGESKEMIGSLETLKRNADIEHKKYKRTVEDLQRKLIYIDRVLFK